MTKQICGAAMGGLGFAVSLIIGLSVNNTFTTVILRGVAVLVVFYVLGVVLAALGHKVVQENFDIHAEAARNEAQTTSDPKHADESKPENEPPDSIAPVAPADQ